MTKNTDLSKSQQDILNHLKTRGPQSIKILAKQLDITTMGVRQHIADLANKGFVEQTKEEKQTRGRPVRLWRLSRQGHGYFPDTHAQLTVEIIDVLKQNLGHEGLNKIIDQRSQAATALYQQELEQCGPTLQDKVQKLSELRSAEGFMCEIRLLPDGWLLVENHCPIFAAAQSCGQLCQSELECFQALLAPMASVSRTDYLLAGARRCAYKITPSASKP